MNEFHTKIVGVTHDDDFGTNRQHHIKRYCKPGKALSIKQEPDNKYDKNAISIWVKGRFLLFVPVFNQIGFINSELAEELTNHIYNGGNVEAKITDVTGGKNGKSYGVNISINKY